jgi:hypothetical protein
MNAYRLLIKEEANSRRADGATRYLASSINRHRATGYAAAQTPIGVFPMRLFPLRNFIDAVLEKFKLRKIYVSKSHAVFEKS